MLQVLEMGQVGAAPDSSGVSAFFVHFQRDTSRFGDATALVNALLQAGDDQV